MTTHQHDQHTSAGSTVVNALYDALARGDVSALLAGLDERIEWVVPPGLHYGGTYRGREEVLENVFSRFVTEWRDFTVSPAEIVEAGDRVIALGHYSGTNLATGKPMRTRFVHLWRLRDGVPVHFETVLDTHTMVAAM
ncbi:nuclear transport factor 2 family protein [Streptomyces sp. WAC 00631]|uniref:nuclear transport factor 2 family protein n=1 Tax=unclassified Streptomyces TaxID=2593676 RepID=UPI000F7813F5|nr:MULTISPECIES: nuclear transport factor 2 family protein [unclassified Streptomyces]MCC5035968.1 nuclear transport factor 2 family protein [Streptomyces sp. WAC 00631]MCC9738990.1 nuclear transport factor 2 family protein [Streptomyces sp. MNU89]